jgi:hypothetical protein
MQNYRAYVLDNRGHFLKPEIVSAPNDEEALSAARALSEEHAVEVWLGPRKIGTVAQNENAIALVRMIGIVPQSIE